MDFQIKWGCLLAPTSFGLEPKDKLTIHKKLFEMTSFQHGTWSWDVLYNLPVFLREYYFNEMVKAVEREVKAIENAKQPPNTVKSNLPPPQVAKHFNLGKKNG